MEVAQMKLIDMALVGLGLYLFSRSPGAEKSIMMPQASPTAEVVGPTAPSAPDIPSFENRNEALLWARGEINTLDAWFRGERRKLQPLQESIWALQNKIGYMRGYPGDTAAQQLPGLQSQLDTLLAQQQEALLPLHTYYKTEKPRLVAQYQSFKRGGWQ